MASDALRAAAEAAFPGEEWDDSRLDGLRDLIKECGSSDYGSDDKDDEEEDDMDEDDESPVKSKKDRAGGSALALLFGKPKK